MNVANNHADDFGAAGERSTERALGGRGLRWTGRPGQITIMRRSGLRIALLGFAPYRWAARLEQVRVAQALVRKAAAQADLVVVAMHAGAEGSGATHVPHGTETFLGENRGDSRRFAHAVIDAGADLVVGSGPARDPRHGALPRPPDRLLDRQLRRLQELRHRRDALAQRDPARRGCAATAAFAGGTWVSLRLDGNALPHLDPSHASARLVAQLSREDFGSSAAHDRRRTGRSGRDVRSWPCRLSRRRRGGPSRNRASRCRARGAAQEGAASSPAGRSARAPTAAARRRRLAHAAPGASGRSCSCCWSSTTGSPRRIPDKPERAHIAYSPQFLDAGQERQRQPGHDHRAERRGRVQASRSRSTRRRSRASRPTSPRCRPTTRCSRCSRQSKVEINAKSPDSGRGLLAQILLGFGPTLLILGIIIFAMRRATAGGGALGSLGRSKAKRYEGTERVTFDDVAGIEEAEQELVEVVDFLKNPGEVRRAGRQDPARRAAHRARPARARRCSRARSRARPGVPFFSASASEFVEMIVGVGASRVRDLFAQAKAAQPAIVFIDELDAIGRARGGGASLGGHDEREQTLNQILTEMDGFSPNSGVIVLAATNRPDVLDKALLRPGPLRPPRVRAAARPAGAARDPAGAHALGAALARGRPRLDRLDDAGHGRRRSREPRQRGRAAGRPPRATRASRWPTSRTPWRRSCWASSAA